MSRGCVQLACAVMSLAASVASAEDRDRAGATAPPPPREPLYKGVERDLDRGNGRVTDPATYELDRLDRYRERRYDTVNELMAEQDRRVLLERQAAREQARDQRQGELNQLPPPQRVYVPGHAYYDGPPESDVAKATLGTDLAAVAEEYARELSQLWREPASTSRDAKEAELRRRFDERMRATMNTYRVTRPATQPTGP